jgi:hypothetical protein
VLASDRRFLAAVRRDVVPAVILGVAGFAVVGIVASTGALERWEDEGGYTAAYLIGVGAYGTQGWAWAMAALGIGLRVRGFAEPLPRRVADSAMPFFLIHQPVILALAFFVVGWDAGVVVKLPVLVLAALAVSVAAAWALSRTGPVRAVLGVKVRARSEVAAS